MRDEEQRRLVLALHVSDQSQHLLLHGDVQRCRRLIGDDDMGVEGKGLGDQHALAHATRKFMRIALQHALRFADVNVVEQAHCPVKGPLAVHAGAQAQPIGQLVTDASGGVERCERILRNERDADTQHVTEPRG